MTERGERQLREHGRQAGRPPVQGGRSEGTHVEVGGLGELKTCLWSLALTVDRLTHQRARRLSGAG